MTILRPAERAQARDGFEAAYDDALEREALKTKPATPKYVRIRLPMPKAMRARLAAMARAEGISMNACMNMILAAELGC